MNRDSWARLEEACSLAAELPREARDAFLDEAFAGDPELRAEAASLLENLLAEDRFLEEPIARVTGDDLPADFDGPTHVGPYRIVRPIGAGGMGEVLLAVQEGEGFERHVALKLVRRGMDSESVLRRFAVERTILAGLDHQGIAKLLDAGVHEDGRPYLVMEFVDGLRIDTWCDREAASVETRLRLLQEICAAVQHAHQNLILHRDLKPSNILVTADGSVKLLDFGVGKILSPAEEAVVTRTEARMLTPEYASPEQIEGGAVTTATDVYSLGVVAYELLSGYHPYTGTGASRRDLEHFVRASQPKRPSDRVGTGEKAPEPEGADGGPTLGSADSRRLRRRLAGDLDNIVLKALRKEPERRYASASALAEDIGRHLDGHPVHARPDTFSYRAEKFVRRNLVPLSAAGLAAIALAGAAGWTAVQNQRVLAESERVTAERDKALAVQSFLMETFGAVGPGANEEDGVAAKSLLDAQAASLAAYEDRPELLAEMRHVLADGYERLGFADDAAHFAEAAFTWRQENLGPDHIDTARSRSLLGWIERQRGNHEEAARLLEASVVALRSMGEEGEATLARTLSDLGGVLGDLARTDEAEAALRESLQLRDGMEGRDDRAYGVTANNLATILAQQSRIAEATEFQDASVRALEAALGPHHARVWFAKSNRANLRAYEGYSEELIEEYRDLLEGARVIYGEEHRSTARSKVQLAMAIRQLPVPSAIDTAAHYAEPIALLREAIVSIEALTDPEHSDLIEPVRELGATLRQAGRADEAIPELRRAIDLAVANFGVEHPRTGIQWSFLGDAYEDAGDLPSSTEALETSLRILRGSLGSENRNTAYQMGRVGRRYMQLGRIDEGLALIAAGEDANRALLPSGHVELMMARVSLAEAWLIHGDTARADSILTEAESAWEMDDSAASERLQRFLGVARGGGG